MSDYDTPEKVATRDAEQSTRLRDLEAVIGHELGLEDFTPGDLRRVLNILKSKADDSEAVAARILARFRGCQVTSSTDLRLDNGRVHTVSSATAEAPLLAKDSLLDGDGDDDDE